MVHFIDFVCYISLITTSGLILVYMVDFQSLLRELRHDTRVLISCLSRPSCPGRPSWYQVDRSPEAKKCCWIVDGPDVAWLCREGNAFDE